MVTFTGNMQEIPQVMTGFWTLDRALSIGIPPKPGIPLNILWEVYGSPGIGKTSFCVFLAGKVASEQENKKISIADIEGFEQSLLRQLLEVSGFTGEVHVVNDKSAEKTLEQFLNDIQDESFSAGILDSIGAILPIAEAEGKIEEANMGIRAKLMSKFSKRVVNEMKFRKSPMVVFATSHVHQNLVGMGSVTSGGVVKEFLSRVRIRLLKGENFDDGSFYIKGRVDKLTWGIPQQNFLMGYLADYGFSQGFTAVLECIKLGIAKRERVIKLGDESFGYLSNIIRELKDEKFNVEPFNAELRKYYENTRDITPEA